MYLQTYIHFPLLYTFKAGKTFEASINGNSVKAFSTNKIKAAMQEFSDGTTLKHAGALSFSNPCLSSLFNACSIRFVLMILQFKSFVNNDNKQTKSFWLALLLFHVFTTDTGEDLVFLTINFFGKKGKENNNKVCC